MGLIAIVSEVINMFFPILLSYNKIQIITIGLIIALFNILSLVAAYVTGTVKKLHTKRLYHLFSV